MYDTTLIGVLQSRFDRVRLAIAMAEHDEADEAMMLVFTCDDAADDAADDDEADDDGFAVFEADDWPLSR
jgi:hypothetical protein